MTHIVRKPDIPYGDGPEWLDLLVADKDGTPRRVMAIGTTILLDDGSHVSVGLARNGYRQVWRPA